MIWLTTSSAIGGNDAIARMRRLLGTSRSLWEPRSLNPRWRIHSQVLVHLPWTVCYGWTRVLSLNLASFQMALVCSLRGSWRQVALMLYRPRYFVAFLVCGDERTTLEEMCT